MKISIIQSKIRWEDKKANLQHLGEMITGMDGHSDLIILPETFNTGFSMNPLLMSEEMAGPTYTWMLEIAKKFDTAICGSYFVNENAVFRNRFVFVDKAGRTVTYDKRHLFSIGGESDHFSAGHTRAVFNHDGFRINPVICYDLRFPVWLRNRGDYDLLVCVANWPEARKDVWTTLLRARAIENQVYVAGVNCIGTDNSGIRCAGESQLIDPKGKVIVSLPSDHEGISSAEISLPDLTDFRSKFPVWRDADDFSIS